MRKNKIIAYLLVICMFMCMMISCSKTENAMEYKGETVSFNLYSYWMSQIKSSFVSSENDTNEYWDTEYSDGSTYEERLRQIVNFNVKVNLICKKMFKDMGLEISESDLKEIEEALSDMLNSYGSKSELNTFLSKYNINYDMLYEIYKAELRTSMVFDALYSEGGERYLSEEKIDEYFKNTYHHIDIIMISDSVEVETDSEGNIVYDETSGSPKTRELTEQESQAKKQLADDIITRLDRGEDFDDLKSQYNEDPNKSVFTNGYYISSNNVSTYGSEMVLAAQNMQTGEYKKLEFDGVICILMCKELEEKAYNDDNYADQLSDMITYCKQDDFNSYMKEFADEVVVNEDVISKISVKEAALMGS